MSSATTKCEVLYRPDAQLGYLPEGPYQLDGNRFSWVSIQHDVDSTNGSLNIFDLGSGTNLSFQLSGRPGFAFPTADDGRFVVGLEREVGLFNTNDSTWASSAEGVDSHTSGTIINDGVLVSTGIIFGCKDLKFEEQKAGLYFFRPSDNTLSLLRNDQLCSNGKVILSDNSNSVEFLDIDTPTKQVVKYSLDTASGKLSTPEVVLDLTGQELYPDGMVATPDGTGVIIAMFNPETVRSRRSETVRSGKRQLCSHLDCGSIAAGNLSNVDAS